MHATIDRILELSRPVPNERRYRLALEGRKPAVLLARLEQLEHEHKTKPFTPPRSLRSHHWRVNGGRDGDPAENPARGATDEPRSARRDVGHVSLPAAAGLAS